MCKGCGSPVETSARSCRSTDRAGRRDAVAFYMRLRDCIKCDRQKTNLLSPQLRFAQQLPLITLFGVQYINGKKRLPCVKGTIGYICLNDINNRRGDYQSPGFLYQIKRADNIRPYNFLSSVNILKIYVLKNSVGANCVAR